MKGALPSEKELSATEKLLQSIRGTPPGSTRQAQEEFDPPSGPQDSWRPLAGRFWRLGHKVTIGIDFGATQMRLVKISRSSEHKWQVLAWKIVPYRASESPKLPSFADFLGTKIQEFAGSLKDVDLWASVPPTQLDVRRLRIPKVPRKQLHGAVFWTLKKEAAFDAQESLLDFEIHGEVSEKGIPKLAVLAYTIPRQEIRALRELFERSGLRLTGISLSPFALQNFFRTGWIRFRDQVTASLYIGNDHSRIDIFRGDKLVFTRGIRAGVKSMQEAIWDVISEQNKVSAVFSIDELEVPSILEDQQQMRRERANTLLLNILSGSPDVADLDLGLPLTEADSIRLIAQPLERIIRQIEMTFKHFTSTSQDEIVSMLYIYSSVVIGDSVLSMIGDQLGIESQRIDPFSSAISPVAEVLESPPLSQQGTLTAALGLALSDNSRTPNFLFTQEDREEEARVARINMTTFAVFLTLVVLCMGVFFYQGRIATQKRGEISQLNSSLQSSPFVNQTLVTQLAGKVQQQHQMLKERVGGLAGVAILGELSYLTPPNVRLMTVSLNSKGADGKSPEKVLTLDGIVRGDRQAVEASLAGFVMKLSSSPLLRNPQVQSSGFKSYQSEGDVLHFVLKLELS